MSSARWAKGSTRSWRRVRAFVLLRDGSECRLRYPGICTGAATQVHHTGAREVTGDDPAYLVAACSRCNHHAGDPLRSDPEPLSRGW